MNVQYCTAYVKYIVHPLFLLSPYYCTLYVYAIADDLIIKKKNVIILNENI